MADPEFSVTWSVPPGDFGEKLDQLGPIVLYAVAAALGPVSTEAEAFARANAAWQDRTGNARAGLFATVEVDELEQMVAMFVSHGAAIEYGRWLELANGGKYAILIRTIQTVLPDVERELRELFK